MAWSEAIPIDSTRRQHGYRCDTHPTKSSAGMGADRASVDLAQHAQAPDFL